MPKLYINADVFTVAFERLLSLYDNGHRVIVGVSGGKDSTVCMEMAILAARYTNRLPVEAILRDEEIMFPGTFEYLERVHDRKAEVKLHWTYGQQPLINMFDRDNPYWWAFDPLLDPSQWVRSYPDYAVKWPINNIEKMIHADLFPPPPGKETYKVLGLRAQESFTRKLGIFSSKSWITKKLPTGVRAARPIYDWQDADVWRAIKENNWDYSKAYDVLYRYGVPRNKLRLAPPTMSFFGIELLKYGQQAWPQWFDRVCERVHGVRLVAKYGFQVLRPQRKLGESWEECFYRTCVDEAPEWIKERALFAKGLKVAEHRRHATAPFPQKRMCLKCSGKVRTWRQLAYAMYNGDPMGHQMGKILKDVDPEFFRPGTGKWD